ncbi:MAG: restriction endonuclease subunit S [Caldilineaceae bacterium]|nr:restriction endonuclease subunit S [Caldilineaceae bacterium]
MIDLNPNHLETVRQILAYHVPACEVRAFGSRVTWNANDYSDLDLAVVGVTALDRSTLARLKEAFEESDLPMQVDVLDWHGISQSFQKVIERDSVVLQEMTDRHSGSTAWNLTTVGEFAPFVYGKALPERVRNLEGNIPVFGSNGVVGSHDVALTDGPTIVIGRKGTAGAVHYSPGPCWPIDTTFFLTGEDPDLIKFVYYALKTLNLESMNTDSAVPGLNRTAAHARVLKIPMESEQRAIAHILGTLDDKIELNRRMNQTLEEMARALFKSWFVDFDPVRAKMDGRWRRGQSLAGMPADLYDLFPDGMVDSELGEIPEGWEVQELGDLIELAYGKALKADNRRDGTIPVYGSNGQVGWHDEKLVSGPGIVVGRKGNPGTVTWVDSDFFPIDTTFYVLPKSSDQKLLFLFFALAEQDLPSIAADSAVPGLNRNLAYMNKQLLPNEVIVAYFEEIVAVFFARCNRIQVESRTLGIQRDTLLPGLIGGELQVTEKMST